MKYKVIIVDDQYIARELFEYYIKSSDNYELENSLESAILVESYLIHCPSIAIFRKYASRFLIWSKFIRA